MVKAFGIDLGTTNSCAAIMQDGRVKIIVNKEGENTTPSVVFFNEEGEKVAIGQAAKSEAIKELQYLCRRPSHNPIEGPTLETRWSGCMMC